MLLREAECYYTRELKTARHMGWSEHVYFWKYQLTSKTGSSLIYCSLPSVQILLEYWTNSSCNTHWSYSLKPFNPTG